MTETFLKSMTGFGMATLPTPQGRFEVEIQSVNRRHLEINLTLPKPLIRFENEIRKLLNEKVARGQLNVFVRWKSEGLVNSEITVDVAKAKALKLAWEKVALEIGLNAPLTFDLFKDVLLYEEKAGEGEESLKKAIVLAIDALDAVKSKEGQALRADFAARLKVLQEGIEKIEQGCVGSTDSYRQKLTVRLEELFSGHSDNEEKILKEVAIFAERIDITEEIVRFKTHLKAFLETLEKPLKGPNDAKGKKFEFILQELGREINTIGSKTQSGAISTLVIDMKCELEKMREQVQNIE